MDTVGVDTVGLDTVGLDTVGLDTDGVDTNGVDTNGVDTNGVDTVEVESCEVNTLGMDTSRVDTGEDTGAAIVNGVATRETGERVTEHSGVAVAHMLANGGFPGGGVTVAGALKRTGLVRR